MLVAKLDGKGDVAEFPISVGELRRRLPNISFPDDLRDCDLSHLGYAAVPEAKPPKAKQGHKVVLGTPVRQGKRFKRVFKQEPLPAK